MWLPKWNNYLQPSSTTAPRLCSSAFQVIFFTFRFTPFCVLLPMCLLCFFILFSSWRENCVCVSISEKSTLSVMLLKYHRRWERVLEPRATDSVTPCRYSAQTAQPWVRRCFFNSKEEKKSLVNFFDHLITTTDRNSFRTCMGLPLSASWKLKMLNLLQSVGCNQKK